MSTYGNDTHSYVRSTLEEFFLMVWERFGSHVESVGAAERIQAEQEFIAGCIEDGGNRCCLVDEQIFAEVIVKSGDFTHYAGGNEHELYLSTDKEVTPWILKLTHTPNGYGARSDLCAYLENLVFSNFLFGDDIRLVFFVEPSVRVKVYRLLIAQPFVEGNDASQQAITDFLLRMGFVQDPREETAYRHACGTSIYDARPANVLVDGAGDIFPIDVQIMRGEKYLQHRILSMVAMRYASA